MNLGQTVIQRLLLNTDLEQIVKDRIRGRRSEPGDVLPRVTVEVAENKRRSTMNGPTGLADAVVRITAWAADEKTAYHAANIIRKDLDGFRGVMGEKDIQHFLMQEETEADEPSPGNETQGGFGVTQEYSVLHRETFTVPAFAEAGA